MTICLRNVSHVVVGKSLTFDVVNGSKEEVTP